MTRPTIFEAAGGESAILALAQAHHQRCLDDPLLNHPFSHDGKPDHIERLARYWGEVLGGPAEYTAKYGGQPIVVQMHAGTGAPREMGDRFVDCFVQAADDVDLPSDPELRAALRAYMEWAVADMFSYNEPDPDLPGDLATPRWSWDGLVSSGRSGT